MEGPSPPHDLTLAVIRCFLLTPRISCLSRWRCDIRSRDNRRCTHIGDIIIELGRGLGVDSLLLYLNAALEDLACGGLWQFVNKLNYSGVLVRRHPVPHILA